MDTIKHKKEILRYVGDLGQICGIKEYILNAGKANRVKAFDIKNGSGLEYTVLSDRGLDISNLSFKGINCSYLSKTGIVAPAYYGGSAGSFFQGFYAGFLTTCGLRNVGSACEDNGESFGMHGRASHIPAEEVCASTEWVDNEPVFTVSGKIRESSFFGENLLLERKIICKYRENRFVIRNTVENQGFKSDALMLLLHFNLGYPLLSADSFFLSSSKEVVPRDAEATKGISEYSKMQHPTSGYAEQVFYHDLNTDREGNTLVALINPQLELGISISFNKSHFFNLTQWKQMGEGEYALGMEPGNCYVGGRTDPRNKDILTYLQPGETKHFDVTVEIFSGDDSIKALKNKINELN